MGYSASSFPDVIYDAHHHLWDLSAVRYPWLMTKGVTRFFGDPTPIQKNYLTSDLRDDFGDLPVKKTVHIQVGAHDEDHLLEAEWIQEASDQQGLPNAMIAFCDLSSPDRNQTLDSLSKLSSFRGVRQIIGRAPKEDAQTKSGELLHSNEWQAGLKEISDLEISFDLQLTPSMMADAYESLKQVDHLRVALCHCGSPWFLNPNFANDQNWDLWRAGIEKLAWLPNMYCKISGLGMFNPNWNPKIVKDIFEVILENFGPERCMFGTNFPVDKLYGNYRSIWENYLTLSEQLNENEKQALFSQTCGNFYRI